MESADNESLSAGEDADQHAAMIGRNVRRIRNFRGVSAVQLAREAGVSRGTLYQLETGRGNPRMDTLYALARVLEVALSDFVASPGEDLMVVRSSSGVLVGNRGLDARLLQTFNLIDGLLELSELRLAADVSLVNDAHLPGIYEHVLVAAGTLRTGPQGSEEILYPGDYMKFSGDQPHVYQAMNGPVAGILLMEYPSRIGTSGRH